MLRDWALGLTEKAVGSAQRGMQAEDDVLQGGVFVVCKEQRQGGEAWLPSKMEPFLRSKDGVKCSTTLSWWTRMEEAAPWNATSML
jgi:hypothetical protein